MAIKESKKFNLSDLATDVGGDGTFMDVRHPATDAPVGIRIKVVSQDDPEYRNLVQRMATDRLNATIKSGKARVKVTPEQVETDNMKTLVALTKGWTGVELDGKVLEFTPANAEMVYKKFVWLREQVQEFTSDRANFLGN